MRRSALIASFTLLVAVTPASISNAELRVLLFANSAASNRFYVADTEAECPTTTATNGDVCLALDTGKIIKRSAGTNSSLAVCTAFDHDPSACAANQWATDQSSTGALTCSQPAFTSLSGNATVAQGGTGLVTHTQGAIATAGGGTANDVDLTDVAAGSMLASGGTSTIPAWRAVATCTSSAATTCTITSQRAGCLPVCSMTTSVSTTFRAALASTTITCTFGTSGTNSCNCLCL